MMLNCGTATSGERRGWGGRDAFGVCNKRWIIIEGILIEEKSPVESIFAFRGSSVDCFGGGGERERGRRVDVPPVFCSNRLA